MFDDEDLGIPTRTTWHTLVVDMLTRSLREQCPQQLTVQCGMAVKMSQQTAPEPDISIVRASALGLDTDFCLPQDVRMAAEVVSPESEERDREDKPKLYAAMGIPAFWLIERRRDDTPVVHEHRLIGAGYHHMRTVVGRFATDQPFPIDVPLRVPPR